MSGENLSGPEVAVALFPTRAAAEEAVSDLKTSGFADDEIEVITTGIEDESASGAPFAEITPATFVVPAGTVEPSGSGFPFSVNSTEAPLLPALARINRPDAEPSRFSIGMKEGHALVSVRAGPRAAVARTILERNGGSAAPR